MSALDSKSVSEGFEVEMSALDSGSTVSGSFESVVSLLRVLVVAVGVAAVVKLSLLLS